MTPRKLLGTSAVLIALGAGVFLLVSCQDANEGSVEVVLRPPSTAVAIPVPTAVHLTVPRRYIARSTAPSNARSGVERLFLEIERAEATPLRIEIAVRDPFPSGLGERRRDEAMNQPRGSQRQLTVPPPDHPQEITEYVFTNMHARAMAYYFKTNDDGVFVDCSELPRCRGFQTWRGLLDVQYEYTRADLDDPRPMNATVQQLLESFEPS